MKRKELTQRDRETLGELETANRQRKSLGIREWARPLDCGGMNGSHHSPTLNKLARLGYVEVHQRSSWCGSRGSKEYRVSQKGRQALREKQV